MRGWLASLHDIRFGSPPPQTRPTRSIARHPFDRPDVSVRLATRSPTPCRHGARHASSPPHAHGCATSALATRHRHVVRRSGARCARAHPASAGIRRRRSIRECLCARLGCELRMGGQDAGVMCACACGGSGVGVASQSEYRGATRATPSSGRPRTHAITWSDASNPNTGPAARTSEYLWLQVDDRQLEPGQVPRVVKYCLPC